MPSPSACSRETCFRVAKAESDWGLKADKSVLTGMFGLLDGRLARLGNAQVAFSLQVAKTHARFAAGRSLRAECARVWGQAVPRGLRLRLAIKNERLQLGNSIDRGGGAVRR
jgi:hypothetical protein